MLRSATHERRCGAWGTGRLVAAILGLGILALGLLASLRARVLEVHILQHQALALHTARPHLSITAAGVAGVPLMFLNRMSWSLILQTFLCS